ncbi:hypothetical protein O1611_g3727 [Lasiodiplodia mahajangana]|uniref:Uncharacterized protein n=1 Tax=Lasiodiplodia mahajangana TaxID=1108764 RepID=A0ACC2JQY0_9PEZI|nr:hypothetical protein O1611_g3727 [Lasiodiplodia mahajangana]
MDEEAIILRLKDTSSVIENVRRISGNPGISLGVMHHGKVIYRANYGYRDMDSRLPPTSDTVFPIASMTKALIAASFARLVDAGQLTWETKLSTLVPEYRQMNDQIKCPELVSKANLIDLLAHRLGLTAGNNFWSQKQQQVLIDKTETANIVGSLQPLAPFRSKFMYLNWGYGLAGEILENLTKAGLEEHFQRTLFQPLGMTNTTMAVPPSDNYVKCYMTLSNGTPSQIPPTAYEAGKARAGAGACKSTVNDLMVLYKAWMEAEAGGPDATDSPFKRVHDTWTPHIEISGKTKYGLGWVITELPSQLGLVGLNEYECPELPVVAKGTKPQRLIYSQGSVCGSLSAVYLLPETQSAIVVLGNSFDLTDTPDWISQILLEALLDAPEPNDFPPIVEKTAAKALSHHQPTVEQLAKEKVLGTKHRPLEDYFGRYYNRMGNFFLEISAHESGLKMCPQGFENTAYFLEHYHYDTFAWPCDRDAEAKLGLFPQFSIGLHKVSFEADESGEIISCNWQIDKAIPQGEVFTKK